MIAIMYEGLKKGAEYRCPPTWTLKDKDEFEDIQKAFGRTVDFWTDALYRRDMEFRPVLMGRLQ